MLSMRVLICVSSASLLFLPVLAPAVSAEDAAAGASVKPKTTGNPKIDVDELELLLEPLRTEELKVEIEGWIGLVQDKVTEISAAELAVKRQNREIEAREAAASKAEDAASRLKAAQEALEKAKATNNQDDIEEATEAVRTAQEALREAESAAREAEQSDEAKAASAPSTTEPAGDGKEDGASATEKVDEAIQKAEEAKRAREAEEAAEEARDEKAGDVTATALPTGSTPDAEVHKKEAEKKAEVKTALLDRLATLRDERTALVARANTVVSRYETVGGEDVASDVTDYRNYLSAVSGIVTDLTDLEATIADLVNWVKSPEGGIKWGINIAQFAGILILFMVIARIAGRAVQRGVSVAKNISSLLRDFIVNSVRRTILAVGIIVAVSALGVEIGPLLALIGAAGFVIAFALQGTLSNFASGLLILLYRPFDVGDFVDVAGVAGKVNAMNLMSTTLTTPDNKLVIVPNNSIWGSVITNVTGSATRRVDLVFGIGYGDDVAKAQKILEEITTNHPLVLEDPAPVIQVHELGDSSVNFVCRPWSKTGDYWSVYWDITRQVKQRFDEEGVSIPFPQRDVHVYNQALPPAGAS